jgi:DNA-binding transcriptional LysR family regulator
MDLLTGARTFVAVVEVGSFAGAARSLGVSRSVVTKHVADLERRLKAQLLQRSTRQVTLTPAGQAFLPRATALLEEAEAALAAVTEATAPFSGSLRVNAPMTFGTRYLAAAVAAFLAPNPDLRLELVLNDRFVDPIAEGFDVSVRVSEPEVSTSLVLETLAPARRVLCAAPGYLAGAAPLEAPRDLAAHRCLGYGYQAAAAVWRLAGPDGVRPVPVDPVMWSNNGEALRHAALAGTGIAQLPTFIVGADLAAGRLVPVLTSWKTEPLSVHALYARHRHVSPRVMAFVAHLTRWFGRQPSWEAPQPAPVTRSGAA